MTSTQTTIEPASAGVHYDLHVISLALLHSCQKEAWSFEGLFFLIQGIGHVETHPRLFCLLVGPLACEMCA